MSDESEVEPEHLEPDMIEVTFRVPARLLEDYRRGVGEGYYADLDEALQHGLVDSWRHHRGRYSTLRIDIGDAEDKRPDTEAKPPVDDVLAARDAFRDGDADQQRDDA